MPKLAINDSQIGSQLKACRVLTPDEVKAVEMVKRLRKQIIQLNQLDQELAARLEAALDNREELQKLMQTYLTPAERIRMGLWPEGESFLEIEEAQMIQAFVIDTYREDLRGFRIACLFQEKISPVNRRGRLGTQMRLPGKMRHLSGWDAVTTLDYTHWQWLSDADRQRLVHHELEHLEHGDEGQLMIRSHDFEDFVSIFSIYGAQSETGRFCSDSLQKIYGADGASQFDMLQASGA